jgi:hypothetical protein
LVSIADQLGRMADRCITYDDWALLAVASHNADRVIDRWVSRFGFVQPATHRDLY